MVKRIEVTLVTLALTMTLNVLGQGSQTARSVAAPEDANTRSIRRSEAVKDRENIEKSQRIAVIVSVGEYDAASTGLSRLQYTARDAVELETELRRQGYKVTRLQEGNATAGALRQAFTVITENIDRDNGTLLFYFSGHGFQSGGKNYLATYGTRVANLAGDGIALDEVTELMTKTGARRRMAFVDACRNDPNKRDGLVRSFTDLQQAEGLRVLYSTKPGTVSYEDEQLQHGVFTHYLLAGLRGGAKGPDGLVTFGDLAAYVTREMKGYNMERGRSQIPFQLGESSGDFLLADSAKAQQAEVAVNRPPVITPVTNPDPGTSPTGTPTVSPTTVPAVTPTGGGLGKAVTSGASMGKSVKNWQNTLDRSIYRVDFDNVNMVIRQAQTNAILATLEYKKDKKGQKEWYEGRTQLHPASLCPGGQGQIRVEKWSETRIDLKVEMPGLVKGEKHCNQYGPRMIIFTRWQNGSLIVEP